MKIRPVGAELFHADRRAYMTKLTVAFLQFCEKAPTTVHTNYAPSIDAWLQNSSNFWSRRGRFKQNIPPLRRADKNHKIYPVCCVETKWQTAGQDSHKQVAEVERGFLQLSVGRNHWREVVWRHFLLQQGNNVATSYAHRRGISRN